MKFDVRNLIYLFEVLPLKFLSNFAINYSTFLTLIDFVTVIKFWRLDSVDSAGFDLGEFQFKIMYRVSSKHPNATKEAISTTKIRDNNVRITRSKAKALGVSMSPSKPAFKQEPKRVARPSNKRMASDVTAYKHKRRAVLKDVTNTLAESAEGDIKVTVSYAWCLFSFRVSTYWYNVTGL